MTAPPTLARSKICLSVVAALLAASAATTALAQTTPKGKVLTAASAIGKPVLDPNGDNFVSKTATGFVTDDVAESEIPYIPLPAYGPEPVADTRTGASGGVVDLVDTSPSKQAVMVFYNKGADNLPDTADDRLLFRMRLGKDPQGAFGYSVLLNTDRKFGTTGINADPNAIIGNPGFEVEIIVATGGANTGLSIYNVDGLTSGVRKEGPWTLADHSHRGLALTQDQRRRRRLPRLLPPLRGPQDPLQHHLHHPVAGGRGDLVQPELGAGRQRRRRRRGPRQ